MQQNWLEMDVPDIYAWPPYVR